MPFNHKMYAKYKLGTLDSAMYLSYDVISTIPLKGRCVK